MFVTRLRRPKKDTRPCWMHDISLVIRITERHIDYCVTVRHWCIRRILERIDSYACRIILTISIDHYSRLRSIYIRHLFCLPALRQRIHNLVKFLGPLPDGKISRAANSSWILFLLRCDVQLHDMMQTERESNLIRTRQKNLSLMLRKESLII